METHFRRVQSQTPLYPGRNNIVADALSRLEMDTSSLTKENLGEHFGLEEDDLPKDAFPLSYKTLMQHQQSDKKLQQLALTNPHYSLTQFHGGGKTRTLITKDNKIVVPATLQKRCVNWYHLSLCHPGVTRTEQTIRQHFTWKNLRQDVEKACKTCQICQLTKKKAIKYGKLPAKDAEAVPWDTLCVDLIGPYKIESSKKKGVDINLHAVTMIDPATGWFEIKQISNKEAHTVAEAVEQTWLSRYPWPTQVIFDRGSEFMGEFSRMIKEDYGLRKKPITARNPQANSIIERVHQTIGQMLRTFRVQDTENLINPLDGILAAISFALRATVHTTTQYTPTQMVFGRDHVLNIKQEIDRKKVKENKSTLIQRNNERENNNRIKYTYTVRQKIIIKTGQSRKY